MIRKDLLFLMTLDSKQAFAGTVISRFSGSSKTPRCSPILATANGKRWPVIVNDNVRT